MMVYHILPLEFYSSPSRVHYNIVCPFGVGILIVWLFDGSRANFYLTFCYRREGAYYMCVLNFVYKWYYMYLFVPCLVSYIQAQNVARQISIAYQQCWE